MKYRRVLIKISGEALSGGGSGCFSLHCASEVCCKIKSLVDAGVGVSIVVGGGNIIRGRSPDLAISRETADSIGMLATAANGIFLKECLINVGVESVLLSPVELPFGIMNLNMSNIEDCVASNKTIIFVAGLGFPYFSTDTVSVVGAVMTKSDVILKATKTDGIYDMDPEKFPEIAEHIPYISHNEAIAKEIMVMDNTAFALAKEYKLEIIIFSMNEDDCFMRAIKGDIKRSVVCIC